MGRQRGWSTAVALMLFLLLAACGGADVDYEAEEEAANDVEATGSESVGDILPTPITGAKVLPTRASVAGLVPDILIVAPSTNLITEDLNMLAAQLALPNARFALVLYANTGLSGTFDFVADAAELTAVFEDQTLLLQSALTGADALAAGIQLPGWRSASNPRLILFVTDDSLLADAQMMTLAATAVAQNMRLFILSAEETVEWEDVAAAGNGRVQLLTDNPRTGAAGITLVELITEVLLETTP